MTRGTRIVRNLLLIGPLVAVIAAGGVYAVWQFDPEPPPPPAGGGLVVVVVFDQMRGDYLERFQSRFGPGGFERMKRDGVWYADAHLPYAPTATGSGHASISTGLAPDKHGIIENAWYDRKQGKTVYAVTGDRRYDRVPAGPSPGVRLPDGGGLAPDRLLAPTVGDAATAAGGKVVSLSIKDRAAVLLGGKKPTACYCFDTATGEFHTSDYYRDTPHQWVTAFNASKAADRWTGQAWQPLDGPAPAGPDDAPGEATPLGTRTFPHALPAATDGKYYAALENTPFANELLWELAREAIEAEALGRNSTPDLLLISFSANDVIGHAYGPDSHEVADATARADQLIAGLIDHLNTRVGSGRWTLVVTSDHGICPLPEAAAGHPTAERFHPGEVTDGLAAVLDERFGRPDGQAGKWVEKVDWPWVYFNQTLLAAEDVPPRAMEEAAAQWCAHRPRLVQAAYTRSELAGPPLTEPVARRVQRGFHPGRSGDVYILASPYTLPMGKGSVGTTHGTPHDYDTHVPVLAFGHGVPRLGRRPEAADALIVAALAAKMLGVAPPGGAATLPAELSGE